jgi:hypothetical protein
MKWRRPIDETRVRLASTAGTDCQRAREVKRAGLNASAPQHVASHPRARSCYEIGLDTITHAVTKSSLKHTQIQRLAKAKKSTHTPFP